MTLSTIPAAMTAAVYTPGDNQLVIAKDYPVPKPAADEVLLKIRACGVCHSDVFFLNEFLQDPRKYIMGHEASGEAVALGAAVSPADVKVGKLYAVLGFASCVACMRGKQAAATGTAGVTGLSGFGIGQNGGFAEYAVIKASQLVPVPENVPAHFAAVMADAGVTAYKAITRNVKAGDRVLIYGVGGLGQLAVQIARHLGARVYAVDMRPSSRALALEFGAERAFDVLELQEATAEGFTVDVAVDFVVNDLSFNLDFAAVQRSLQNTGTGGKIVIVGASNVDLQYSSVDYIAAEVTVVASLYGSKQDLTAVLDLAAKGAIRPQVEIEPLERVNEVLVELRGGAVRSRKVVVPQSSLRV